jgi:hypothetical protein
MAPSYNEGARLFLKLLERLDSVENSLVTVIVTKSEQLTGPVIVIVVSPLIVNLRVSPVIILISPVIMIILSPVIEILVSPVIVILVSPVIIILAYHQ